MSSIKPVPTGTAKSAVIASPTSSLRGHEVPEAISKPGLLRFARNDVDVATRPRNDTISSPPKREIRRIFDSIAFRYDFVNSLLSLNLDKHWREMARNLVLRPLCHSEAKPKNLDPSAPRVLPTRSTGRSPCGTALRPQDDIAYKSILDLGIGTGRFLQCFLEVHKWEQVVGLDFSSQMLRRARTKLPAAVRLVEADFHELPFLPSRFDLVISSFTLRSVKDLPRFFRQVSDILTPKGKAAFLCLTRPHNALWKILYGPYLKFYVPFVGRMASGDSGAYRFLSASVEAFQEPSQTADMMRCAGFSSVSIHSFTWGSATLILGRK